MGCRRRIATLVLIAVMGGCRENRPQPGRHQVDSGALAERRAAFLREQELLTKRFEALKQERTRLAPFQAPVTVRRPTVVAFYPAWLSKLDSTRLRRFLAASRASAAQAGWAIEERHAGSIGLWEPQTQARYTLPVPPDSLGYVVAAPVRLPQVIYGDSSVSLLPARLQSLRSWLPGSSGQAAEGL